MRGGLGSCCNYTWSNLMYNIVYLPLLFFFRVDESICGPWYLGWRGWQYCTLGNSHFYSRGSSTWSNYLVLSRLRRFLARL